MKVVAFRGVGAWLRSWVAQEGEHETPLEVFPATDDEEAIRGFGRRELSSKPGFDLMPEIREDALGHVQWKDGCRLHSLHTLCTYLDSLTELQTACSCTPSPALKW